MQKLSDDRAADLVSHVAQALAEFAQALARPQQGRLRIAALSGSTSVRRSSSKLASVSLDGLRPAPGLRTRPAWYRSPDRSSATPRPMVLRAMPVARSTALTPP